MYLLGAFGPVFLAGVVMGAFAAARVRSAFALPILYPLLIGAIIWALHTLLGLPNFGFPLFPNDWYPFAAVLVLFGSMMVALLGATLSEIVLGFFGTRRA